MALPIQKRRTDKQVNRDSPAQYNNFDLRKLKSVDYNYKSKEEEPRLCILQTAEQSQGEELLGKNLVSYRVEGSDDIKYVSDLYLNARVKKIMFS